MNKLKELGVLLFMSVVVGFVVGAGGISTVMYAFGEVTSAATSLIYAGVIGLAYLLSGLYKTLKD